jgi:hypothetical protein
MRAREQTFAHEYKVNSSTFEEVLLHGLERPVQKSYLISQLSFKGLSMAVGVLALAGKLRHGFCVAAGLAAEFLSLRRDTIACGMSTFWRGIHRISFDRLSGSLKSS